LGAPSPKTVLIVDDSDAVRDSVSMLLEDSGFRVRAVASSGEALAFCMEFAFDLALIDSHLGADSGKKLADEIKAQRPSIAVILMSGSGDLEGSFPYRLLPKPFARKQLVEAVRQALEEQNS
jgi:DNA-binding NtrC family response regulator